MPADPLDAADRLAEAYEEIQQYVDETRCIHICDEYPPNPPEECSGCKLNATLAAYRAARKEAKRDA